MHQFQRSQMLLEIAHCFTLQEKNSDIEVEGEEPKIKSYNSLLNEELEVRQVRPSILPDLGRQAILARGLTEIRTERSLDMINELSRPNPLPHPLSSVQQTSLGEEALLGNVGFGKGGNWQIVFDNLGKVIQDEASCMTCTECDENCLEIKSVQSKPVELIELFLRMMLHGVNDATLKAWHPANAEMNPQESLGILTFLSSHDSLEKTIKSKEVCYTSQERWSCKLDPVSQQKRAEKEKLDREPGREVEGVDATSSGVAPLAKEEFNEQELCRKNLMEKLDLEALQEYAYKLTKDDFWPEVYDVVVSMVIVDREGRTIMEEAYSPPNFLTPLQVPLQNVSALKTQRSEIKHINAHRPSFGFPKCLIDSTNYEESRPERPYCSMKDDRIWKLGNRNQLKINNFMKALNPALVGTPSTTSKLLQNVGHSRQDACAASAVLLPVDETLLVMCSAEDLITVGLPRAEGKIIPYILSCSFPLQVLLQCQEESPTVETIQKIRFKEWSLEAAYNVLFMRCASLRATSRGKVLDANFRAHALREIFELVRTYAEANKEVLDYFQFTTNETSGHRLMKVHRDPVNGGTRTGADCVEPYENLKNDVYKNVLYRLIKNQVPRILHESYCLQEGYPAAPDTILEKEEAEDAIDWRETLKKEVQAKSAAFRAKWEEICPEVKKKLPCHLLEPHNEEIFGKDRFVVAPLLVRIDRMEVPLGQTESSDSDSEDSS